MYTNPGSYYSETVMSVKIVPGMSFTNVVKLSSLVAMLHMQIQL